jgi:hypothetical protein
VFLNCLKNFSLLTKFLKARDRSWEQERSFNGAGEVFQYSTRLSLHFTQGLEEAQFYFRDEVTHLADIFATAS